MNAKTAKAARRAAEAATVGKPPQHYRQHRRGDIQLAPGCTKYAYKMAKRGRS